MAAPKIRKDAWGRILLLGCSDPALRGRIAIAAQCCRPWHIAVRTQGFQHPGCIELDLGGRSYTVYPRTDTSVYSKCYIVAPAPPGTFPVRLRWQSGHSPYPEIIQMEAWVLGIHFPMRDFPKAPDEYVTLAKVTVVADGRAVVGNRPAGRHPDLVEQP